MNVFDELYSATMNALEKTGEKTERFLDKSKIKAQLSILKGELKKCYAQLGSKVYNKAKAGEDYTQIVNARLKEIDMLREKIAELTEQSELNQYYNKCKSCGYYNEKEEDFCKKCGANLFPYFKTVYKADCEGMDKNN